MWGEPPTGTMLVRMKERFKLMGYPEYMRSRINAFKPGGSIAKKLATMQVWCSYSGPLKAFTFSLPPRLCTIFAYVFLSYSQVCVCVCTCLHVAVGVSVRI